MWTFEANARGYMFFLDGKPIGGAGILSTVKSPTWRAAAKQRADNIKYCQAECNRRNERENTK